MKSPIVYTANCFYSFMPELMFWLCLLQTLQPLSTHLTELSAAVSEQVLILLFVLKKTSNLFYFPAGQNINHKVQYHQEWGQDREDGVEHWADPPLKLHVKPRLGTSHCDRKDFKLPIIRRQKVSFQIGALNGAFSPPVFNARDIPENEDTYKS